MTGQLSLCDGGRCQQILAAIAAARAIEGITERQVGQSFEIVRRTLTRLGHRIEDQAVLAAVEASVVELATPAIQSVPR